MAWQFATVAGAGQTRLTLPDSHRLSASDVLRLVILHGDQQTIDFIGGVDFFAEPPSTIRWTDLPVQAGDTLIVFNYGASQAVPNEPYPITGTSLLERGLAWLTAMQQQFDACRVLYQRGPRFAELKAPLGKTTLEIDDTHGIEQFESRDFLIPAQRLVLVGERVLPLAGDRIRQINGPAYEVLAPAHEPPFRYSDPFGKVLRIHTKQVR